MRKALMGRPGCPPGNNQGEHSGTLWFVDPRSRSWACMSYSDDADPSDIRQAGPRRLWDEIETAHQWWIDAGKPDLHAWQFTITSNGQTIEPQPGTSPQPGLADPANGCWTTGWDHD